MCLDFANTANGHLRDNPHEYLKNYDDLLLWARHAGILSAQEKDTLARAAQQHTVQAARAYARAIKLREMIYRIFSSRAHGAKPLKDDLQALNAAHSDAFARSRIAPAQDRYVWEWTDKTALDRPLWPIVLSAAALLISSDLARVRACAGEGCDWLFIDNSRNHLRRWCSMDECGNRAKGKRFRERRHGAPVHAVLPRQTGSSADS